MWSLLKATCRGYLHCSASSLLYLTYFNVFFFFLHNTSRWANKRDAITIMITAKMMALFMMMIIMKKISKLLWLCWRDFFFIWGTTQLRPFYCPISVIKKATLSPLIFCGWLDECVGKCGCGVFHFLNYFFNCFIFYCYFLI